MSESTTELAHMGTVEEVAYVGDSTPLRATCKHGDFTRLYKAAKRRDVEKALVMHYAAKHHEPPLRPVTTRCPASDPAIVVIVAGFLMQPDEHRTPPERGTETDARETAGITAHQCAFTADGAIAVCGRKAEAKVNDTWVCPEHFDAAFGTALRPFLGRFYPGAPDPEDPADDS